MTLKFVNPILLELLFNPILNALNRKKERYKLFTLSIQVNASKYSMSFEYEFLDWGVRISDLIIHILWKTTLFLLNCRSEIGAVL